MRVRCKDKVAFYSANNLRAFPPFSTYDSSLPFLTQKEIGRFCTEAKLSLLKISNFQLLIWGYYATFKPL